MRDTFVVGVYTTKFGRYPKSGIKDLASQAVLGVLADAAVGKDEIQTAWFANAGWGRQAFQHCIRGQVALRPLGIEGIPIMNVENACAGGSTAFHGAWKDVATGQCDVALAIGAEKTFSANKYSVFAGFLSGTDVALAADEAARLLENMPAATPRVGSAKKPTGRGAKKRRPKTIRDRLIELRDQAVVGIELGEAIGYESLKKLLRVTRGGKGGKGDDHSPFMDIYAFKAREHMRKYGSTARQLAVIAAKSHWHSSMNPNAQYTFVVTPEEVLADRLVATPLTRAMCAPIGDGAAAAILMSEEAVHRFGLASRAVRVRASVLGSGRARTADEPDIGERLARIAYERAGVGPGDIDCVEVHDATAFGELHQTEALGFFPKGEGGARAERGETRIDGKTARQHVGRPLVARAPHRSLRAGANSRAGHAASRRRRAAPDGRARLALAENGGGAIGRRRGRDVHSHPRATRRDRAFVHERAGA